jgi:hypothetical protein
MDESAPKARPGMATVPGPAKLKCYALVEDPCELVPAPPERAWMDSYVSRHPYRCLPLSIANSNGWLVLCPVPLEVEWTGGAEVEALTVRSSKPLPGNRPLKHFATSNFGHGIVTLHTDYLFQTPPGWDLMATGPLNAPKYNSYPLSGIIETDWLPYPFTMNWRMISPGKMTFEEGEAFCFIFPIPKQALLDTQPEILRLDDDPELKRQHESFRNSRDEFFKKMAEGDSDAIRQGWQRYYFTGRHPDGTRVEGHVNKLRLKDPVDLRKPLAPPAVTIATNAGLTPKAAKPDFSLLLNSTSKSVFSVGSSVAAAAPSPARRWEQGSALDWIDPKSSVLNVAGRARLRDGLLSPSPNTRRIASAADADGHDFLCVENLLSAEECARLRLCYERHQDLLDSGPTTIPYWRDRMLQIGSIRRVDPEAADLMIAALARGRDRLSAFYKLTAPIYADVLQMVRWPVGMSMPPHADNAYPGGQAHPMPYREFGAIAYLNDDYEGGELYFTALDIAIKPRRGMFLAFTGGFHHEHAVARVTGGDTRLTMASFFTFDRRRAHPLIHPESAGGPEHG